MARRILIGRRNMADVSGVVLTASGAAGSLVAGNLLTDDVTEVWRVGAVSGVNLVVDLGAAAAIGMAALINTNLTSGATWRIRGATSEANLTASPGYDSGTVSAWPAAASTEIFGYVNPLSIPAAPQSYRYWRIDLTDASNPAGYLQAGRLVLATVIEPGRNFRRGRQVGWSDPSVKKRTRGGQLVPRREEKLRYLDFEVPGLTKEEALDELAEVLARHGATDELAICLEPDDVDRHHLHFIWGTLDDLEPLEDPTHNRWIHRFRLTESL